jgi:hypothetical protein
MTTQAAIQAVINQVHQLNAYGVGVPHDRNRTAQDTQKQQAEWQAELLASTELFEQICAWLAPLKSKIEIKAKELSSYTLKHVAERNIGRYVPNGVFIAAAIHCGFLFKPVEFTQNVLFNISKSKVKKHVSIDGAV